MARLAARQDAVVSRGQLAACGISSDAITVRIRRGHLHRVYRGVYSVIARQCLTPVGVFTAAVLACGPRAVLSHYAAAVYWSMLPWDEARRPEVTVLGSAGRGLSAIHVHRTRGLNPRDVWQRGALLVTSPERAALDLAAVLDAHALRRMLRQAQAERRLNVQGLAGAIERASGHHGIRALRAVVADGPAPTRSELEDIALDLVDRAGIARPDLNRRRIIQGEVIVPDMRWPELHVVVELDGAAWHEHRLTREHDARKQALMEADGDRVLRVTWSQAVRSPQQTAARIRAALEQARRAYPPSSSA